MIVFNNYFKIVKKFLPMIIIYTVIFIFFAVMSSSSNADKSFVLTKPNIAIINKDLNSNLTKSFVDYVGKNTEVVDIKTDDQSLKDALFYREVDYIMIIPNGFGNSVLNSNPLKIETLKVPDSYSSTYSEMLFNRYLNIASVYVKVNMSEDQIINNIQKDLEKQANVKVLENNNSNIDQVRYFFNFANYTILAICIYVVSMLINIFNNKNIKKRNLSSSMSYKKINNSLFIANACITFLIWLSYILVSIFLYKDTMFTQNGLLLILNSFIFSFTALSIGFLIGNLVKSKEAQNGLVNIIALGTSFICGSFVPQEYLGSFVLSIGKFFPSYWYIKNNNDIALLSNMNIDNLIPIIINMVIILLFGIGLFILTGFVSKSKLKKN